MKQEIEICNICFTMGAVYSQRRIPLAQQNIIAVITEINPFLVKSGFVNDAPFNLLNGVIRFTDQPQVEPIIGPINVKHNELPFAFDLPYQQMSSATNDELRNSIIGILLGVLLQVCDKFNLPKDGVYNYAERVGFNISCEDEN